MRTLHLALLLGISMLMIVPACEAVPPATPSLTRPGALPGGARYDIGTPVLTDIWVDPIHGQLDNDGRARDRALPTLLDAWRSIPAGMLTTTGYRIRLVPGNHIGAYLEDRHGTYQFPILIEPADGPGTVTFVPTESNGGQIQFLNSSYVYLQDLQIILDSIPEPGDGFQCERCDHLLLRRMTIRSRRYEAQTETVKLNQSQYIYIEDSDISGAGDNAIDAVAIQYGHIIANRIYNSQDWCIYLKGGSAYFRIEGNEISNCGTGGFTAGQGSGFQFMTTPWLHYEAYDIKFINNIVHDAAGACMGVNGGYNILLAYNTCYRIGQRSHLLEFVFGSRSCDGQAGDPGRAPCTDYLAAGGWGTTVVDDGTNFARIPNKHIFVYNNIIYNPDTFQPGSQHLTVFGPYSGASQTGSNIPVPTLADDDLRIVGNIIWSGSSQQPLGIEDSDQGCQDTNTTCNAAQLRRDNAIGLLEPQLANPSNGDFRPAIGSNIFTRPAVAIPSFSWSDTPARPSIPPGTLANRVDNDRAGNTRTGSNPPGAYTLPQINEVRIYIPVIYRT